MRAARIRLHGFTLVELLVAIWIMALVSVISWRGLSALVATRDRLGPEADEVRALLTGFGQMEFDLAHVPNANPTVVLVPLSTSPVLVQTLDGSPALQILRFSEPLADGGSALQQVTYSVVDGALMRAATPPARTVELALTGTPTSVRVVPGVASMQLRVWRDNQQGWVAPVPGDPTTPTGVEVVVTRNDGTRLRRVLLVG